MANPPVAHIGREHTFESLGKTWRAGKSRLRIWNVFIDWAKPFIPDPIEVAAKHLETLTMKDVAIMRQILIADLAEEAAASKAGRPPVLMAERYKPAANDMLARAQEQALLYQDIHSPGVQSVFRAPRGTAYFIYLLLKENHPEVTYEVAMDIIDDMSQSERDKLLGIVTGSYKGPEKNGQAPAA